MQISRRNNATNKSTANSIIYVFPILSYLEIIYKYTISPTILPAINGMYGTSILYTFENNAHKKLIIPIPARIDISALLS